MTRSTTRRMVLRDMGKAGLAVLVLGATACATDDGGEQEETSTSEGNAAEATSTPPGPSSTLNPATTRPEAPGFAFHRVDLGFVSAYLLYRGGEAALVDTGVGGSQAAIELALTEIGLGWGSVGQVIITHKHPDHQGSLEAVLSRAQGVPWYAGANDMAAINASTAGTPVSGGESIFDLEIIATPGHTPGHISVLDAAGGILVAGDALNGANGGVIGANPDYTEDMQLANASIETLAGFDYEVVLFGHGEPVLEGGSAAVAALATGLG